MRWPHRRAAALAAPRSSSPSVERQAAIALVVIGAGWLGVSGAVVVHSRWLWFDVAAAGVLVRG